MRRSAAKVIDNALTKVHVIFGQFLGPGDRDAEKTVNDIISLLDDEEFIRAWAELQDEVTRPGVQEPLLSRVRQH
jgi:hypothetical protein